MFPKFAHEVRTSPSDLVLTRTAMQVEAVDLLLLVYELVCFDLVQPVIAEADFRTIFVLGFEVARADDANDVSNTGRQNHLLSCLGWCKVLAIRTTVPYGVAIILVTVTATSRKDDTVCALFLVAKYPALRASVSAISHQAELTRPALPIDQVIIAIVLCGSWKRRLVVLIELVAACKLWQTSQTCLA